MASFAARVPGHLADLQRVCTNQICPYGQLGPEAAQTFQALGLSLGGYAVLRVALTIAAALTSFVVVAVLVWRKADDWLALLMALWLVFVGAATITGAYGLGYAATTEAQEFSARAVNYLAEFGTFLLVFLLFPAARSLRSAAFWLFIACGFFVIGPQWLSGTSLSLVWYSVLTLLAVAQLYRYWRVTGPVEQQQTKWVIFGIALLTALAFALLAPVRFMPSWGENTSFYNAIHTPILIIAGMFPPIAIANAILRHRLWDIDVLINKTLVYGTLTGLLVAIYAGLILSLESLVVALTGRETEPAVIVVATLAIAALFQPLRRRVQQGIDRRFYRRKYDAARILAAFAITLRSDLDLSELHERLLAVVDETMQPTHVSLWLRRLPARADEWA